MTFGSVYTSQDELLVAISSLYLDGKTFDLDPCFNKGGFYRVLGRPQFVGDLKPAFKWLPKMDVLELPFQLWNLNSAVFDPPFLVGKNQMTDKYGSFGTVDEMFSFFRGALDNFIRVLKPGGILVVKVQDTSVGGQNFFSHINVSIAASMIGFELIDLFLLVNKHKYRDKKLQSRIATKEHCYFLVFKKVERKIRKPKF